MNTLEIAERTRRAGIALILAAGATFAACDWWKGDPGKVVAVSGNIELTEVKVAFKLPGKLVEIAVKEGSTVKKGMVLGRLDTEQIERQREREMAALAATESQIVQLGTAIQYQRTALAAEIELRNAELSQVEAKLKELLAGARAQEVEQAQAAAQAARTQFEQARKDWERAQILHKSDDISSSQHDQFKARHESAAAALKQAEERLSLVREGPRREEIESARAVVARAAAALKLSQAARLETVRKEQELAGRRAERDKARAQVAVLDSQLKDAVALSPIDGVVLVKSAEAGEVVAAGTAFVTVGDLDHPWLRGYINEQDLGRVKQGAGVKVTTDSYPGKVYQGRVSYISPEAEFTPKQIQTAEERVKLVYRIKIDLSNPQHELKSNMPADAEIQLGPE